MDRETNINWNRIAPGYYTANGGWEIIRVTSKYGTDWRLILNNEWQQSFSTLRDAKFAANNIS